MLGPALGEGDEANAAAPASQPGVAGEELVEFGVSDAAEALEIGLVDRFTGAYRIACQLTGKIPPRDGEQLGRWQENLAPASPARLGGRGPCWQRP